MRKCPEFSAFWKLPPGSGYFLSSARKGDTLVRRLRSGSPYDQPVHAPAHVAEVSLVTRFEFGNGASRVTNFAKRLAHRLPVHVPMTEVHPLVPTFLAFEVFQV